MADDIEEEWTIVVVTDQSKKRRIKVKEDCLVWELIQAVANEVDQKPDHILLIYANLPNGLSLETEEMRNQRLSHYKIQNNSLLTMALRMLGGIKVMLAVNLRKRTLEPLDGFITVTTDPSEPDMISWDDSVENRRAKMPCGHVIGPESMTSYCKSIIAEGDFRFRCPNIDYTTGEHCNREWPFFLVRHVACLDADELETVEKNISANVLKRAQGIQQCPGCSNWCFRDDPNNDCVICSVCTKEKCGELFQFCWQCMGEWMGGKTCGNNDCSDQDRRLKIIQTCLYKKIEEVMAPSTRGCPRCGVLIEHKDQCKHMTCPCCKCSFCFFCLKEQKNGEWQCEAYTGDCQVAPRQTWLPRLKDVKFEYLYKQDESS